MGGWVRGEGVEVEEGGVEGEEGEVGHLFRNTVTAMLKYLDLTLTEGTDGTASSWVEGVGATLGSRSSRRRLIRTLIHTTRFPGPLRTTKEKTAPCGVCLLLTCKVSAIEVAVLSGMSSATTMSARGGGDAHESER